MVKALLERMAVGSGAAALARRRHRGQVLVLAYHNVLPDGAAPGRDRSLHLPRARFAAQLDLLMETHEVVPLDRVLDPPGRRPRAVITFDDAYRGAVVAAVPELARRELPATIFVAPGFLGGRAFWWDEVLPDGAEAAARRFREQALEQGRGLDGPVREAAERAGLTPVPAPEFARAAGETELAQAARTPGITLGSHSWSHPNLTRLTPVELVEELERPHRWLRERFPGYRPWLSYPYGLASPPVEAAARAAGYTGAWRIAGGWLAHPAAAGRFALPRLNIPAGVSPDGFRLRAAGL